MPGAEKIQLDEQSRKELKSLAASRTSTVRLWERATIIMELAVGTASRRLRSDWGLLGRRYCAGNSDFCN